MTDVLIRVNIAGHDAGDVTELTDRLQKHVDAGNAVILKDDKADKPKPKAQTNLSSKQNGSSTEAKVSDSNLSQGY